MGIQSLYRMMKEIPSYAGIEILDVTTRSHFGDCPLHVAAGSGDLPAIYLLLNAGADINSRGDFGDTPLLSACRQKKPDAARLLIKHGADVSLRADDIGQTAAEYLAYMSLPLADYGF